MFALQLRGGIFLWLIHLGPPRWQYSACSRISGNCAGANERRHTQRTQAEILFPSQSTLTRAYTFFILEFLMRLRLAALPCHPPSRISNRRKADWNQGVPQSVPCKKSHDRNDLQIPAEVVSKASQKVERDLARVARIPGFRPGKAPVTLVRRRFAQDIEGEVVQSLVPEYLGKALDEKKLVPVTRPEVDKIEFKEGEPLRVHAVFEVLPEFELGEYKNLSIQVDEIEAGDAQVEKALEEMRERAASFVPVEGRAAKDGDSVQINLSGTPAGGGDPVKAENILVPLGEKETLASFTENLRGSSPGETKQFEAVYPDNYPDEKLTGKTFNFSAEVQAIKEKKLPDLNDEFAKDAAGAEG